MTRIIELVGALAERLGQHGLHVVHTSECSLRIQHTLVQVRFDKDSVGRYARVFIDRKHRDFSRDLKITPGCSLSRASLKEITIAVLFALTQDAREDPA